MKQSNITIPYEEEKLTALRRYMGKKDLELEAEMMDALTKLYEKYVPAPVREYIDENDTPPGEHRRYCSGAHPTRRVRELRRLL